MDVLRFNTTRAAIAVTLLLLIVCVPLSAKDKKPKGPVNPEIHPDMLVEIAKLEVQKAQKPCDNWAWWAAVQSVFEQQNLPLPQSYFVDHADGGACLNDDDHPLNLYDVATSAAGDYALPNGQTFHADSALGKPPVPAAMIVAALRAGRPMIIVWRNKPYLVQGIVFDDQVYPNGQHAFIAKELRLVNPADAQPVKVKLDEDDVAEITGVADIVVTPTKR